MLRSLVMGCRLADLDPAELAKEAAKTAAGQRRSKTNLTLQILVGVILGLVLVYVDERHKFSISFTFVVQLGIGYLGSVLIHEAGHATTALMLRFRIQAFAVWPIRFYRDAKSWRVGWLPLKGPKGFTAINPDGAQNQRTRQFLIVLAGPLTSMLAAILCWFAIGEPGEHPKWIHDQVLIAGLWCLLIAMVGLLPIRSGATVSDGARLQMLLRGGEEWDRLGAQQTIVSETMRGVRPRDWSAELVEMAAGQDDASPDARAGRALRYNWLADGGRVDEAEQQLIWLLHQPWPEATLRMWQLQAAWFAAVFQDDALTARRWFDAGSQGGASAGDCSVSIAKAALAFVERRWADLSHLVNQASQECDRIPDRGTAKAIHDGLQLLTTRAEQLRASPGT